MNKIVFPVLILIGLGCEIEISQNSAMNDNPVIDMPIADTIGVETGDQRYVFGDICDVSVDSNGNLLVLDAVTCEVLRFTPAGEYLGKFAGLGSAPGELMDPMDMTVLSGGGVAIADWDAWGLYFYDSTFVYTGFSGIMPGGSPLALAAGYDNSVLGFGVQFWSEDDLPAGEYFLASWKDSVTETFRYMEGLATIEPLSPEDVSIDFPMVCFDSSSEFELYAALSTDSTYTIHRFSKSGEEISVLEQDWERIALNPVSEDEMQQEATMNGQEISDDMLYANAIQGIYCDDLGNVWVRLGTAPYPIFDVYNSAEELIAVVTVTELLDPLFELQFEFHEDRVFAWNTNPVDYPKIIVLENSLYF